MGSSSRLKHNISRLALLVVSIGNMAIATIYMAASVMIVLGIRHEALSSLGEEFGNSFFPLKVRIFSLLMLIVSGIIILSTLSVWFRGKKYANAGVAGIAILALFEVIESIEYFGRYGWVNAEANYMAVGIMLLWLLFNAWAWRLQKPD